MATINPTRKQRNLAKVTLENPTLTKGELVALGGYTGSVIKNPNRALESQGYLKALDEYGLTEELLTKSLVADIKAKPKNRKPELELGYKIRGMLNPEEKPNNQVVVVNISSEIAKKYDINESPVTSNQ